MNEEMKDRKVRCKKIGKHIAETSCTVRMATEIFGVSKSTVYDDVTRVLPMEDENVAANVAVVLMKNKKERCIRGGMATKAKYAEMKANK